MRRGYRRIEYPPFGYRGGMGVDDAWGELGEFLTVQDVQDLGLGLLSGGSGVLFSAAVMPRIPWIKDTALRMGISTTLLGILGGFLLTKLHRGTGIGFASGTGGYGLASIIADLVGIDMSLKPSVLPATANWGRSLLFPGMQGGAPLSNAVVERERLYGNNIAAIGSPVVNKVTMPALRNAVVEPQRLYGVGEDAYDYDDPENGPGSYLY